MVVLVVVVAIVLLVLQTESVESGTSLELIYLSLVVENTATVAAVWRIQ